MKKIKGIFILLFFILGFVSCSERTLEEDATYAAQLTLQSDQYARDHDLSNASRLYNEVQTIINKYKELDKYDEFYLIYSNNLEDQLKIKYGEPSMPMPKPEASVPAKEVPEAADETP